MTVTKTKKKISEVTLWVKLNEVKLWADNPNEGDIGAIIESIRVYGYRNTIYLWQENIVKGGNHSVQALRHLLKTGWQPDLKSTALREISGEWHIKWDDISDMGKEESDAFGIALNRTTRLGHDDDHKLVELLQHLAQKHPEYMRGTGYSGDDLDELLETLNHPLDFSDLREDETQYTNYSRKIKSPVYAITGEKPETSALFNDRKTQALMTEIEAADLDDEIKTFLKIAAQRHTVLHFSKIAEFYAHADRPLQRLMENSALVIIDFNQAIELGFVKLTDRIQALVQDEYGDE